MKLKPEQYIAIQWLSLPKNGGLTVEQIAAKAGVSRATVFNWKKDPAFELELKREIVRKSIDRLPEIFESIPDHIINDGNAALFKTLLQAHDLLTHRVEVETKNDGALDTESIKARLDEIKNR